MLRQDPDVILIGEIRDDETARIGIRAALTGVLVFSTLHGSDAPGTISNLYNFGIPGYQLSSSLLADHFATADPQDLPLLSRDLLRRSQGIDCFGARS